MPGSRAPCGTAACERPHARGSSRSLALSARERTRHPALRGRGGEMTTTRRVTAATMLLLASTTLAHAALPVNPGPPASPVRLVFIHHSTGRELAVRRKRWLRARPARRKLLRQRHELRLGAGRRRRGSDTIGDHTDIGHWYNWFVGPEPRRLPGGALRGQSAQLAATRGSGRTRAARTGSSCSSRASRTRRWAAARRTRSRRSAATRCAARRPAASLTVANAKGIYIDLLKYFATRTDKLFVVVTAPPLVMAATNATQAATPAPSTTGS